MKAVLIDQALLDAVSRCAAASPRKRRNRNFHGADSAPAHRLLNAIEPGSYVPPHRHLEATKDESIIVVRGRLGAVFFDDRGEVVAQALLEAGGERIGVDIPHGTWHTVLSLAPGTVFFEAKAGPYVPPTPAERPSWAPTESDSAAPGYFARLRALFD